MGIEIERRFRVNLDRLCPNGEDGKAMPKGRHIKQGYLALDPSIRVRVQSFDDRPPTTPATATLTIKTKGTISRGEWNIALPWDVLKPMGPELIDLAQHGVIEKVRYSLRVYQTEWELDRFLGVHEGLWLAEVELPSEDAAFDRPSWLGEEVTDDPRFTNAQLARTTERFWAV
jgi:CYTH domain-containing protein